jgi:hypothetical protein
VLIRINYQIEDSGGHKSVKNVEEFFYDQTNYQFVPSIDERKTQIGL